MKRLIFICVFSAISTWVLMDPDIARSQFPGFGSTQPEVKESQYVMSSNYGRFVFGQISESDKDRFMLDTFTGRLWRISESGKIGLYLKAIPYKIDKDNYSLIPEEIKGPNQNTD